MSEQTELKQITKAIHRYEDIVRPKTELEIDRLLELKTRKLALLINTRTNKEG